MNSKNWKYILTIAEEGSFSKAAKKLYVSQPSLSQTINALEREIGTQLFDRSTVPLSVTYAGEQYIRAANEILSIESSLAHKLEDINNEQRGKIRMGLSFLMSECIVPNVFAVFHREYPHIELNLQEDTRDSLIQSLLEGKIDIAMINVLAADSGLDPDLKQIKLFEDNIMLVAPAGEAALHDPDPGEKSQPEIDLLDIRDQPFILLTPSQELRRLANKIFNSYGIKPNIFLETKNQRTALFMVANRMGYTITYQSFIKLFQLIDGVSYYRIKGHTYKRAIYICYNKNRYLSKPVYRLIELIRAILNQ